MKTGLQLSKRGFTVNTILFVSFFTSYYFFLLYLLPRALDLSAEKLLMMQASFSLVIGVTIVVASFFINKFDVLHVIYVSVIVNSSLTILFFFSSGITRIVIGLIVGIFFAFGQLSSFVYFWNLTGPEERGRIAGLIGFISLPIFFAINIVAGSLDFFGTFIASLMISLGTLVVLAFRPNKLVPEVKMDEKRAYPEKRTVLLFSIPWATFSLINATLAKNTSLHISQLVSPSSYLLLTLLQLIGVILGALGGGIIADFMGRRLALVWSVTLYGISAALAGLIQNYVVFYFIYIANGLSFGILLMLYSFVIWGDLANKENCARMYSIGLAIFYVTIAVGYLPTQISSLSLVASAFISCFLIFSSNLPIALAPELLSSDFREKIRLKRTMNSIKKIRKQMQD
jgi:hypothetical protein